MALEKFGALWKGKPNSKAVLSGKLEDGRRILVFKNEDKKTDKHPDYRLVEIYDCAGSNSSKVPGAKGDVALLDRRYFNGKATFKGVTDPRWATVAVWCKTVART